MAGQRGTWIALWLGMTGVAKIEDLLAWQAADAFKKEVYELVRKSTAAMHDLSFRDQIRSAAASTAMNIAEGFHRFRPKEFIRFLEIGLASLAETRLWIHDGIDRGHFAPEDCTRALTLAERCQALTLGLLKSLKQRT